jgi:hypothetical protein
MAGAVKYKYWYYYSSEEFHARILRTRDDFDPDSYDRDYSGNYTGPFDTLKAARKSVVAKINGDIDEFREMLAVVRGPATRPGHENDN